MRRFLIFLFLTLVFISLTFAQHKDHAKRLSIGDPVHGELTLDTNKNPVAQWFSVRHGTNTFIRVETISNTDTLLEVYDESERLVYFDDDNGIEKNALLEFYAVANKTYFIKLTGVENAAGPYIIEASLKPVPKISRLRFGSQTRGTLPRHEALWYSVRAVSGGFLSVETFGNLDTVMHLFDEAYYFIRGNDDINTDEDMLNSMIQFYTEPGKTYLFKVFGIDDKEYGAFRIKADFLQATELRLNTVTKANINPGDINLYSVKPDRPGTLTVETSGDTDTHILVFESSNLNKLVTRDHDSGNGLNARAVFAAEADKTYLVFLNAQGIEKKSSFVIEAKF